MSKNIDTVALVERLKARLAARLDPLDHPRTWTQRQCASYTAETAKTSRVISGLVNSPSDFEKPTRQLAELEAERAAVVAKQAELEMKLTDHPDWRTGRTGTERDRLYDEGENLRRQIDLLAAGRLFRAEGVCFMPLAYLDQRIREVKARLTRAEAQLDSLIEQAEQLLQAKPEPISTS
jgi:hypothetical protein